MSSSRFGKIPRPVFVCLALLAFVDLGGISKNPVFARDLDRAQAGKKLSELRLPFIANAGQTDPGVAFYAQTFSGTSFVMRDGRMVYSLPGWALTESPVRGKAHPTGGTPASTRVSYFLGDHPASWRCGLSTFDDVSLGEVWPRISLDVRVHGQSVEKVFTVAPGGDPSRIRMSIAGARRLRINRDGELVVETGPGEVAFTRPSAFQEREGVRYPVGVSYELRSRTYGFKLAGYDPALPVVIDPLLQATYLGGSGADYAQALAIHPTSGDVYVAGYTTSTDFPGTVGGAQAASGGGGFYDAFVARLSSDLTTLDQATYLGGSGNDNAYAIAINATSGEVYVAGPTKSADFPGTAGGAQAANEGGNDAFIARLSSDLTTLEQATYVGGSGEDVANALAIDPTSSEVYVAGSTSSTDFPDTDGGYQTALGGYTVFDDAFVARLSSGLTTLDQATYLGGSSDDYAYALAIHPATGDVYVAGTTKSLDFPGVSGGAQVVFGGYYDAFVARLSADLTTLDQSTYLGGSGIEEYVLALAINPTSGDVFVAGYTDSADFPGTSSGAQATSGGGPYDAFAAYLSSDLTSLDRATYLGGSGGDFPFALAIQPTSGDVYVAGWTDSTNFPGTSGGAQDIRDASDTAFVARLTPNLVGCPKSAQYWKTNPGAWPVSELTLGSQSYTKAQLIRILKKRTSRDASLVLSDELIAAKLNVALGLNEPAATATAIVDADALLSQPFHGPVKPGSTLGLEMIAAASPLASYNDGSLTPGCTP